jgi:hypothetical protein
VDDEDDQTPFSFAGKLNKLTLTIDQLRLSQDDAKRLMAVQRNNKQASDTTPLQSMLLFLH